MSINNVEIFKEKIRTGKVCIGSIVTLNDPVVSEIYAEAGYDFTWIDMEHPPVDLHTALQHIMTLRGTHTAPFVRVAANDPVLMKRVLELVPAAIIVPLIKTAEDAAKAVQSCKYPPRGIRGFGPRRGTRFGQLDMKSYLKEADQHTMVLVQIEQKEAVENLDAILETPGLDGVCLGLCDLSGSMGLMGQIDHPKIMAAADAVIQKVKNTDLLLGLCTGYHPAKVKHWISKGIQWICLNDDCVNLFSHAKAIHDDVMSISNYP